MRNLLVVLLSVGFLTLAPVVLQAAPPATPAAVPVTHAASSSTVAKMVVIGHQKLKIDQPPSVWARLLHFVTLGAFQPASGLKAGVAFTVQADHNGVDTDTYTLTMNGTVVQTLPVTSLAVGVITFPFPQGLPKGQYAFVVTAVGVGGSGISDPLAQSITPGPPSKPTRVRVVIG
jgi:hypothetical protein